MAINFKRIRDGLNLAFLSSAPASAVEGDIYFNTTTKELNFHDGTDWQAAASEDYVNAAVAGIDLTPFLRHDGTVPLSANLNANSNKIVNLTNGVSAGDAVNKSQLDAAVLAIDAVDVSYSNAVSGLTATNVQDAIDEVEGRVDATEIVANAAIPAAEKGANNGVATLDGAGKVPITQLPSSIMTYEGIWNALTNSPTLADGVGDAGMVYRVGTAGTQNLGSGPITFDVGDYVIYSGTIWQKSDTTDSVVSVNGQTGIVTLTTDNVNEGVTNLYFTTTRARTAAVVNSTAGAQTDQAPSVDSIKTYVNTQIAAQTGISATRIADGSVDNTEFQYLNGVTSSIQTQLTNNATAISDHIADTVDAHDASAISNIPSGNLVATDVQGALNELQTDVDTRATSAALTAHTGASTGVHGVTGAVVGTTDTQTLTNKTLTSPIINSPTGLTSADVGLSSAATPQFQDVQVIGTGLGNRFLGRTLALASSTGLVSGGILSIGAPTSTFSIATGTGEVVDVTNPAAPVVTPVSWATQSNVTVTNIGTQPVTYILVNSAGALVQQSTYPTPTQRRDNIFIGRLNHFNNTSISFADTFPDYKLSPVAGFYDLVDAMAPFKIGGLSVSANGANLSMNISAGTAFFRSANYASTIKNPNLITFAGGSPQAFRKMTSTTTPDVADVTLIDPANYDVGGVVTPVGGGGGRSTIQRIYAYKSGAIRVQYGQNFYANLNAAVAAISSDSFTPNPTIENTAILIGYLALERSATDLSNTNQARFVTAARFDAGGQASVGGTTTLQQAYLNSILPQIVLNSTQSAFTIDDAATPLGTDLFQVRNNAGTTDYLAVAAAGTSVTNLIGSGTAGAIKLHNLTTTQRNALTPANGMKIYNTTTNTEQSYINGSWVDVIDVTKTPKNYLGLVNGVNGNGNFELGSTTKWSLFKTTLTGKIPTGAIGAGDGTIDPLTVVTANKLAGTYSLEVNASGSITPGNGLISDAFTLDAEDRAKPFSFSFYYQALGLDTPGTSSNSYAVYLYDVVNSAWVQPSNVYGINQNSLTLVGKCAGEFQTSSNATSYRLVVVCITATSGLPTTLRVDDFVVGPSVFNNGTPVTDVSSNLVFVPNSGAFGTITQADYRTSRVGDKLVAHLYWKSGTTAGGIASIALPTGMQIDASKYSSTTNVHVVGMWRGINTGGNVSMSATSSGPIFYDGSNTTTLFCSQQFGTNQFTKNVGTSVNATNDGMEIDIWGMPILGWSSSVQMSDSADTRVVDFRANKTATQAITANVTNIAFTTLLKDSHGVWNGTDTYTVPVPGDYQVSVALSDSASTGNTHSVYVNGVSAAALFFQSGQMNSGTTIIPNLVAGNTITIRGGTNATLGAVGNLAINKLAGPSAIAATETIAASYYCSANATSTTSAPINFDTKIYDTHGAVTTGAGWRFTAPAAGIFNVGGFLNTTATAGTVTLYLSGTINRGVAYASSSAVGTINTDIRLNAGDYIELRTGTSITWNGGALNTGASCSICIKRVGL